MKTTRKVFLLVLVAVLAGCASGSQNIRGFQNEKVSDFSAYSNLLLEPVDTTGMLETSFLRERKTTFYEVTFPELLFLGEIFPGRIKWYGWVVDKDGRENLAQLLWVYRVKLSGKLVGVLAVEGDEKDMVDPKAVGLSTRLKFAYGLNDKETEVAINSKHFASDPVYRAKIAREHGIALKGLKKADYMYPLINKWNRSEGPRGIILTPLKREQFLQVAEINPAYTYSQKFVENVTGTIFFLDPIATGASAFFDLVRPLNVSSKGWDFDNITSRRTYAVAAKHLVDVKYSGMRKELQILDKACKGESK